MLLLRPRSLALAGLALVFFLCAADSSAWEIIGSIQDDAGNPIGGIGVSAVGDDGNTNVVSVLAVTEDDGTFRIDAFDGSWRLRLDWNTLFARGLKPVPAQSIIVDGADEFVEFVCPTLLYTMRFAGTVIDDYGVPLTNATLSLSALNDYYATATNTDYAGRFDLPLFAGFWDFKITASQTDSRELLLPEICVRTIDGIDQTNFLAVARVPTTEVIVSIQHAFGTNFSYSGSAEAEAITGSTNYSTKSVTDPSGHFTFNLPEGIWHLGVPGYEIGWPRIADTSVAIGLPDQTIQVSGARQEVTWVARDSTNHLRGKVINNLGIAVSNTMVAASTLLYGSASLYWSWPIFTSGYQSEAWTRTDPDGSFDLTLFGGVWRILVDGDSPDGPIAQLDNVGVIEGLHQTNLELVLPQFTSEIFGTLKGDTGLIWQQFRVRVSATLNGEMVFLFWLTPDRNGHFQLPAFDGVWEISPSYILLGSSYPPGGVYWTPPPKTIAVRGTNVVVEIALEPPPTMTTVFAGRAMDNAGAPINPMTVSASNSERTLQVLANTGLNGFFSLGLSEGCWTVSMENFQVDSGFFLGPRLIVDVEPGLAETNLVLVARKATAQIRGFIIAPDGRGQAGVSVCASSQLERAEYLVTTTTDQNGFFALDVIDGDWLVRVEDKILNSLRLVSLPDRRVTLTGANEQVDFVAQRIVGDGRVPTLAATQPSADGAIELRVTSQTRLSYRIEASSNLKDWAPVFTNSTVAGSFTFTNRATPPPAATQFYRAVLME